MYYKKAIQSQLIEEWANRWNPEVVWLSPDTPEKEIKHYAIPSDRNAQITIESSDISMFEAAANMSNQKKYDTFKAKLIAHGYSQEAINSVRFVPRREYLEREIEYFQKLVNAYGDPDGELVPHIDKIQRELGTL